MTDPLPEPLHDADGAPPSALLERITSRVVHAAAPDAVVLFGSASRAEMDEQSDIDLLLLMPEEPHEPTCVVRAAVDLELGTALRNRVDLLIERSGCTHRPRRALGACLHRALAEGQILHQTHEGRQHLAGWCADARRRPPAVPLDDAWWARTAHAELARAMETTGDDDDAVDARRDAACEASVRAWNALDLRAGLKRGRGDTEGTRIERLRAAGVTIPDAVAQHADHLLERWHATEGQPLEERLRVAADVLVAHATRMVRWMDETGGPR